MIVTGDKPEITKGLRVANEVGALAVNFENLQPMGQLMENIMFDPDAGSEPIPDADKFLRLYDLRPTRKEAQSLVKDGIRAWNKQAPKGNNVFLMQTHDKKLEPLLQLESPKNISQAVQMFHAVAS